MRALIARLIPQPGHDIPNNMRNGHDIPNQYSAPTT